MDLEQYFAELGTHATQAATAGRRRILGVVRLSHETDVTTSPERQRESIELWARQHDREIIGWAVDLDVSGGINPWDRPELGTWLHDRASEFDGLCAWKLDRYSRSVSHFAAFLDWCEAEGKLAATADNVLDSTTPTGKMLAYCMSMCAEWERVMASMRALDMRAKARRDGAFVGGAVGYGYRSVRQPDSTLKIEIDPDQARVMRQMVTWRLEGYSIGRICRELKARAIRAPRGGEVWKHGSVHRMLTAPSLLGYQTYKGRVICAEDGLPRRYAEPLVTEEEYKQLVSMRKTARETQFYGNKPRKTVTTPYLLKDLARCGNCGTRLYRYTRTRPTYADEEIYRCAKHRKQCEAVPEVFLPKLERAVVEAVLDDLHDQEVYEREFVPANEVAEQLAKVNRVIDQNLGDRAAGVWEGRDAEFREVMRRLNTERKRLEVLPQTEAHWRTVPTGVSYGERWETADLEARRELLTGAGVEIVVCANDTVPPPDWWDEIAVNQERRRIHSRIAYLRWNPAPDPGTT